MNRTVTISRTGDSIKISIDGVEHETYYYGKAILDEKSPLIIDLLDIIGGRHTIRGDGYSWTDQLVKH